MKRLSVLAVSLAALGAFAGCNRTRGFTIRQVMQKFHGPSGKQLAADMFDSSDADVRRRAVERIAARKSLRREPYLGACAIMVKDPDPTVRSAAIRALAAAGDATYIPNVAAALSSDTDPICRRDAAAALDLLVGDEAVEPLITAAGKDDDVGVRSASAYALRHYPCQKVLDALLACLDDTQFAVRFRAGQALSQLTALDAGTDLLAWRQALAEKDDPFAKPPPKRRPWWNMLGLFPQR